MQKKVFLCSLATAKSIQKVMKLCQQMWRKIFIMMSCFRWCFFFLSYKIEQQFYLLFIFLTKRSMYSLSTAKTVLKSIQKFPNKKFICFTCNCANVVDFDEKCSKYFQDFLYINRQRKLKKKHNILCSSYNCITYSPQKF